MEKKRLNAESVKAKTSVVNAEGWRCMNVGVEFENDNVIVWGLKRAKNSCYISKLSLSNSTSTFLISYPSTFTTL